MKFGVDIHWPGVYARHHEWGILSDEHPTSSHGTPVLVFNGQRYGIAELDPCTKITAFWKEARTGPVWSMIQKAMDAGYPIEIDPVVANV